MKSCLIVVNMAVYGAFSVLAMATQGAVGRVPGIVSPDGKVGGDFSLVEGRPKIAVSYGAKNLAEIDLGLVAAGDTCVVTCTAADGTDRYYYVYFAITEINPGKEASGHHVLVKRVPGAAQIFIATIRNGVDFALYDQNGHLAYYKATIKSADPNNVEVYQDSDAQDILNDIDGYDDGLLVDIQLGQPYFYVFFSAGKKISSGRILAL